MDLAKKYKIIRMIDRLNCYLLRSKDGDTLILRYGYLRSGQARDAANIRKPVILRMAKGEDVVLTRKEWQNVQSDNLLKNIKDLYLYDARYRFEREYPLKRVAEQRNQRLLNQAKSAALARAENEDA